MIGDPHYNHEELDKRFSLSVGGFRSDYILQKAGWYNCHGEKIGFGDLNMSDIGRIKANLRDFELFIILSSHSSFWERIKKVTNLGWIFNTSKEHYRPGLQRVAKQCIYVITKDELYMHMPESIDNQDIIDWWCVMVNDMRTFKPIETNTVLSQCRVSSYQEDMVKALKNE